MENRVAEVRDQGVDHNTLSTIVPVAKGTIRFNFRYQSVRPSSAMHGSSQPGQVQGATTEEAFCHNGQVSSLPAAALQSQTSASLLYATPPQDQGSSGSFNLRPGGDGLFNPITPPTMRLDYQYEDQIQCPSSAAYGSSPQSQDRVFNPSRGQTTSIFIAPGSHASGSIFCGTPPQYQGSSSGSFHLDRRGTKRRMPALPNPQRHDDVVILDENTDEDGTTVELPDPSPDQSKLLGRYNQMFEELEKLREIFCRYPQFDYLVAKTDHIYNVLSRNHKRVVISTSYEEAHAKEQKRIKQTNKRIKMEHRRQEAMARGEKSSETMTNTAPTPPQ